MNMQPINPRVEALAEDLTKVEDRIQSDLSSGAVAAVVISSIAFVAMVGWIMFKRYRMTHGRPNRADFLAITEELT